MTAIPRHRRFVAVDPFADVPTRAECTATATGRHPWKKRPGREQGAGPICPKHHPWEYARLAKHLPEVSA